MEKLNPEEIEELYPEEMEELDPEDEYCMYVFDFLMCNKDKVLELLKNQGYEICFKEDEEE